MKLQMSIKTRMMVSILSTAIVSLSFLTISCSIKAKKIISSKTKTIVEMQSFDNAGKIAERIPVYKATLDSMALLYAEYFQEYEEDLMFRVDEHNKLVSRTHKSLINISTDWDISPSDFKEISDVFIDKLPNKNESAFMFKLASPIISNGNFVGEVSSNIIVDSLLTDFVNPFGHDENMKILMVSDKGIVAYSKKNAERKQKLSTIMPNYYQKYDIGKFINNDTLTIIDADDNDVAPAIISVHPIKMTENSNWALIVAMPKRDIIGEANSLMRMATIYFILCIIAIGIVTFLVTGHIGNLLKRIGIVLDNVAKGKFQAEEKLPSTEIKEIKNISTCTNTVINGLTKASEFAEQIGSGNLNADFGSLSEDDKLGNALINMRDNLQKSEEENAKRKIADEKVNWATLGLAKFGEILHTNSQNINDLTYEILHNLIKYIDVNQGAIYVLDETAEQTEFVMTAAIAYDRRKFMQKRFAVGEDLVGRCAYEHKTIYMTDIPENYITITSGMGSATATTLLLVPLVLNDNVYGIIELAAFQQLEDYKINFVEKLAESIASTIATVKTNERTNNLLNQSKIQAEELASKEEEMRQNMEELQATQEEAARRENEANAIMKVINDKMIVVDYDMDGIITNINDTYAKMLGIDASEVIGQKSDDGVDLSPEKKMQHIQLWNDLRKGKPFTETSHIVLNGKDLWIKETFSPVFDQNKNTPYKVTKVGIDITEQMNAQSVIDNLYKEKEIYEAKIAELESQLSNKAQTIKKTTKTQGKTLAKTTSKKNLTDDNEFNAVVGEQELIGWNESCEMGIIEIDEQLKKLSELANSVYTTYRANKSKKDIKDALRSLIDFAQYHFGVVEGYIEESDYDGKNTFKQSFKTFITKIEEFQNLYLNNKIKSADGLMLFMNKWMDTNIEQMKTLAKKLKG